MHDLIAFIEARLAEDEADAILISAGGYEPDVWRHRPSRSGKWVEVYALSRCIGEPLEALREEGAGCQPVALVATGRNEHHHIVRHGPARALREVQAKRHIVAGYRAMVRSADRLRAEGLLGTSYAHHAGALLGALRDLAFVWSDHPDYRPEFGLTREERRD